MLMWSMITWPHPSEHNPDVLVYCLQMLLCCQLEHKIGSDKVSVVRKTTCKLYLLLVIVCSFKPITFPGQMTTKITNKHGSFRHKLLLTEAKSELPFYVFFLSVILVSRNLITIYMPLQANKTCSGVCWLRM